MSSLAESASTRSTRWGSRRDTQVLVIGAGIAGLSMTLRLPPSLKVVVVTKGALGESNTWYAQGGLAAAVGLDDDPDLHYSDTIAAGAGLCDETAVRTLVEGGPEAVDWLLAAGTQFDRDGSELALGKEAAHSRNRVLHAGGDATGAEIERSLVARLRARPSVTVLEHTTAIDLVLNQDGSCGGAIVQIDGDSTPVLIAASHTVLANGGAGQLWGVTSNPPGATGDGAAMAIRAGATVADLEFTQFHPTVLSIPGQVPFLVTEAIRGEGAWLRSVDGDRFMADIHPLAELAPRDVVARAIQEQISRHDGNPVYLDLRHLDPVMVGHRFPTITARLATMGLDLATDLIPVAPAAHYFVGGIVAGTRGETSIPGLHAIGEVSCTGVHGANRLASNSLLEGLVFGLRLGDRLADDTGHPPDQSFEQSSPIDTTPPPREDDIRARIQRAMSADVAVVRSADGLGRAAAVIDAVGQQVVHETEYELRNLYLLAREVTESASFRRESRGAHYRLDFPESDPSLDHCHQLATVVEDMSMRGYGSLIEALNHPGGPVALSTALDRSDSSGSA